MVKVGLYLFGLLLSCVWMGVNAGDVQAQARFYIEGEQVVVVGETYKYHVFLDNTSGDSSINVVQATVSIPGNFGQVKAIFAAPDGSITGLCLMSVAPQPGTSGKPPPNNQQTTPYFYNNNYVSACNINSPLGGRIYLGTMELNANTPGVVYLAFSSTANYNLAIKPEPPFTVGLDISYSHEITILGAGTPMPTYSLSGKILLDSSGLDNVTVTAGSKSAQTNSSGNYTINGLLPGNYNVVPTKSGYTFTPPNYPVIVTSVNIGDIDFMAIANPTAVPTVTPAPTSIPTGGSGQSYSLSADDVNFVNVQPLPTPIPGDNSPLEVVEEDNTVPPPPGDITPRPPATPFPTPDPNAVGGGGGDDGEVLSVQSIRDLLIPGKSRADKNVVLFNFVSLLTLLTIIIVIIWRIIMLKRKNKLKQEHISDLINGELAALETKLSVLNEKDGAKSFQAEFEQTVDHIQQELLLNKKVKQAPG